MKNYLIYFVIAFIAFSSKAHSQGSPVYCVPEGIQNELSEGTITNSEYLSRHIKTITVTGANFSGSPVNYSMDVDPGETRTPVVHFDKTANILNATLGDKLVIKWTKSVSLTWMHYYVFIDYNQDGVFDPSEAVAWTYYQGKNSKGVSLSNGDDKFEMPEFTIPATATLGKTRIRFKVDWDSKNPCENEAPNNYLYKNAGEIIDFTINIAKAKVPVVTITQPTGGILTLAKENGDAVNSGDAITSGSKLTVTATPTITGMHLKYLLINGEPAYNTTIVTITDDMTISAVFASDWYIRHNEPANGEITFRKDGILIANNSDLAPGAEVSVTILPNAGYEIKSFTINGEDALKSLTASGNTYTTTLIMTENKDIKVEFTKKQYSVILKQIGKWGTLSIKENNAIPNGDAIKIEYGTELTIIARPDPCEESWLEKLTINSIDMTDELKEYNLTATIKENTVIEAIFAVPTYSVTFHLEGEALITIKDEDTGDSYENASAIPQNARISWTITPTKDYKLETIKENNVPFDLTSLVDGKYELGRLDKNYVYDVVLSTQGLEINNTKNISLSMSSDNNWLILEGIHSNDLITMIDTKGKPVRNIKTGKTNISDLNAGCYIVQIVRNEDVKNLKFIKK